MIVANTEEGHRSNVGQVVVVVKIIENGDFAEAVQQRREDSLGLKGRIVDYSNSHGLCYEVDLPGDLLWFEPEELELTACTIHCGVPSDAPPKEHWKMCPQYRCCDNEDRDFNGWCKNCGDPCL